MNHKSVLATSATLVALLANSPAALAWPSCGHPRLSFGPEIGDPTRSGGNTGNSALWERLGGGLARPRTQDCTPSGAGAAIGNGSTIDRSLSVPELPRWRM